jgi:FkbM family methyltransferase
VKAKVERHGSERGGWNIASGTLNADSIVYSVGIGEDASFDLSIIKSYNCSVFAFDPTPRVAGWVEKNICDRRFVFHRLGLSINDGEMSFFEPLNKDAISHTAVNLGNSTEVRVPCRTLESCMKIHGHDKIDLLKMDIEGFEYDVLDHLLLGHIRPKQLLVEFHHFFPQFGIQATEDMITKMESHGYRLFKVSDSFWEYSFLWTE